VGRDEGCLDRRGGNLCTLVSGGAFGSSKSSRPPAGAAGSDGAIHHLQRPHEETGRALAEAFNLREASCTSSSTLRPRRGHLAIIAAEGSSTRPTGFFAETAFAERARRQGLLAQAATSDAAKWPALTADLGRLGRVVGPRPVALAYNTGR